MSEKHKQPTVFIPHGAGPCFFMPWNPPQAWKPMEHFLRGFAHTLPQPPTAIVVVSAHWLAPVFSVTAHPNPGMIFDYYGFPAPTYELQYPAPGEPALAARVVNLLQDAGFDAQRDDQRGFDHGVFIPLLLMFPEARIPVVQLSLRHDLAPEAHLHAGRALAALREEGVLIVGSGMSFHNMRGYGDARFTPISEQFDTWLTAAVEAQPAECWQALAAWEQAPMARLCHPLRAEEHLLPLMVVAGAAAFDQGKKIFSDGVLETTLSAFRFG